jgi:hypothetical protein
VLPHALLFAVLVEVGELLVALGFFAGAVLWVSGRFPGARWARRLNLVMLAALLAGTFLPGLPPCMYSRGSTPAGHRPRRAGRA